MRQKIREERGDTYDPICLSDMESDDEWIAEKENPCLPEDNSWMDVHESFNMDEGAPSKGKRRGPRNLNAIANKKAKGKAIVQVEEEEEDACDIEEEEEENEEETMTLEDDDEDNIEDVELDIDDEDIDDDIDNNEVEEEEDEKED